jgi:transcriptional regulator with XRE-family HTH domain
MPDSLTPQAAVGQAIKEIRLRQGLTQEQLAEQAGHHLTWVSRIESGTQATGWPTVKRLADALGVKMSELAAVAERIELS